MTEGNDDGSVSSRSSSSGGSSAWCGGNNGNGSNVSTSSSYLVRVHAQVMMRDDSRGGWLPRGGGGLSNVSVVKRVIHYHTPAPPLLSVHHHHGANNSSSSSTTSNPPLPPLPSNNQQPQQHHHQHPRNHHHPLHHHHHHHGPAASSSSSSQAPQQHLDGPTKEYLIYGKKISDQSVVLNCSIRKDFEYYKVMPTFHHWRTGEHKFGLTFQTAADARAFDRGVRQAVKELMDGLGAETECAAASVPTPAPRSSIPYPPVFSQPSYFRPQPSIPAASPLPPPIPPHHPHNYYCTPIDDADVSPPEEDVFVAVNLPVNDSMSGNEGSSPNAPSASSAYNVNGGGNNNGGQSSSASPTHLQRISYQPRRPPPALPALNRSDDDVVAGEELKLHKDGHAKPGDGEGTSDCPYVQFVHDRPSSQLDKPLPPPPGGAVTFQPPLNHDYYYPVIEGKKPEGQRERRDSIESIKKANQLQEQQLTVASTLSSMGGLGITAICRKEGQASGSVGKGRFGSLGKQETGKGRGLMGVTKHRDALSSLASVGMKQQCRHCRDSFYAENNPRGSCEYAPDFFRSAIDAFTCIGCARCMLYHCMSDKEGEYVRHPCTCSGGCCESSCCMGRSKRFSCCSCCCEGADRGGPMPGGAGDAAAGNEMVGLGANRAGGSVLENAGNGCGRRWLGLTLLSLIVPCLCCYLPLKGCHSAFVSCGICGGRHEALANGGRHVGPSEDKFGAKHIESKLAGGTSGRGSGRYTAGRFSSGSGRFDAVGGS